MATFADIVNSPVPILVDFYAEWCSPCKFMAPELVELAGRLGEKAKIVKIDVDKNPAIAENLRIRSIPTLMIFKDGKSLWRQSGAMTADDLEKILRQYV